MIVSNPSEKKLDIFTWHIHGSYLYYLSQGNYNLYIPTDPKGTPGYTGRGNVFPFGENVREIPAPEVKNHSFDCILFQSQQNYLQDQFELFTDEQRTAIPQIYLEHDPPRKNPTDTHHIVDNPEVTVVHVTHFNKLMWNNHGCPVRVLEHGVLPSAFHYTGVLNKGVVVVNNLPDRGRRLGSDIFLMARRFVPLDLIGMGSEQFGGIGEVPLPQLPGFLSCYRFFFNPIRYTSLGLAVCEAMMLGMPIVGLATTEMATVIQNGVSGYIDTDIHILIEKMKLLLDDPALSGTLGNEAKRTATRRFSIQRFTQDWTTTFQETVFRSMAVHAK